MPASPTDWNYWPFEPGIVLGLLALVVAYALAATRWRATLLRLGGPPPRWVPPGTLGPERPGGGLSSWQVVSFFGGVSITALSLLSPLHPLGEHYLLSAHMVQHLMITLVAPPLLLLGIPAWMLRPLLRFPLVRRAGANLFHPLPAFALFEVVFVGWHVPALYELSLRFAPAHALEHAAFLALSLVAWWPVAGILPEFPRLAYGGQILYLFFQSIPPTILGAVIALAEGPIYATYWQAPRVFGIDPLADQQLGGLIMWVPGALIYLLALTIVWFLWMERRAPGADPAYGTVNPNHARRVKSEELRVKNGVVHSR